jgi:hypothetical protein
LRTVDALIVAGFRGCGFFRRGGGDISRAGAKIFLSVPFDCALGSSEGDDS